MNLNSHHPFDDNNGCQYTNINLDFTKCENPDVKFYVSNFEGKGVSVKFTIKDGAIGLYTDVDKEGEMLYQVSDGERATAKLTYTGKKLLGLRACFVKEEGKVWFE